ncbi:MAG: YdcF family protein [Muribaculaceae bacterium]|nr:YdcF family protein [Muribaculaceae bacterium]
MQIKSKKLWRLLSGTIILIFLLLGSSNFGVIWNAKGRTFDDVTKIPTTHSALVLGTSPITPRGIHNGSFDNRIKAASELYKAGKVKKLIVSGGDYTATERFGCDEPKAMRDSLIAKGVNSEDIFMDYEGTTTIRSLAKQKNFYCYSDTITIISQGYHNQRALAMADRLGLPAIAFDADIPPSRFYKVKNYVRESLARVKMVYSLFLLPPPSSLSFSSNDIEEFEEFIK